MNRIIKFRAQWKEAKIMVNVECLRSNGSIEFFVPVTSGNVTWNELQILDEPEQYELMQFTGLHDKNGREIYEGDIVEVKFNDGGGYDNPVEVSFENGSFWVGMGYLNDVKIIEVIGNIYENPELLNLPSEKKV